MKKSGNLPFKEWLSKQVTYMYEDCFCGIEIVICDHNNKELLRSYGKDYKEAYKGLESAWQWQQQ